MTSKKIFFKTKQSFLKMRRTYKCSEHDVDIGTPRSYPCVGIMTSEYLDVGRLDLRSYRMKDYVYSDDFLNNDGVLA